MEKDRACDSCCWMDGMVSLTGVYVGSSIRMEDVTCQETRNEMDQRLSGRGRARNLAELCWTSS
jgi:hypothetical protein